MSRGNKPHGRVRRSSDQAGYTWDSEREVRLSRRERGGISAKKSDVDMRVGGREKNLGEGHGFPGIKQHPRPGKKKNFDTTQKGEVQKKVLKK